MCGGGYGGRRLGDGSRNSLSEFPLVQDQLLSLEHPPRPVHFLQFSWHASGLEKEERNERRENGWEPRAGIHTSTFFFFFFPFFFFFLTFFFLSLLSCY